MEYKNEIIENINSNLNINSNNNTNPDRYQLMSFAATPVNLPQLTEKVSDSKDWVYFGLDNRYPDYLNSLIARSSKHAGIINKKARLIGGSGFIRTNLNMETIKFINNRGNELDLDEILYKICYDYEVYGAFALNVIWNKTREKIAEINYCDVSKLRVNKPDLERPNEIESYWISDGWENLNKYKPVWYSGFSSINRKKATQIYYVKSHVSGTEFYGRPEYLPGVRAMELEYEIFNFHLKNIKNGCYPGKHINFPYGLPTVEERNVIVNRYKMDMDGSDNAGKDWISFSTTADNAPTIDPIDSNDTDARFLMLNEQIIDEILAAHQIDPILAGVKTPGGLGSKNEVLEQLELFQNDYVTPKQKQIEKVFNELAAINGITDTLYINKYSSNFSKVGTNITDLLSILQSQIEPVQKYWILMHNGYTTEVATQLSQYNPSNVTDEIKPNVTNGI